MWWFRDDPRAHTLHFTIPTPREYGSLKPNNAVRSSGASPCRLKGKPEIKRLAEPIPLEGVRVLGPRRG